MDLAAASAERRARACSPFLSYGFRPFFLLAGLWAVAALAVLLSAVIFGAQPATLPLFRWHGHEMIFGFVAAAIAGFLLTAVPGWTGAPPLRGVPLAGLAALWLIGRFLVGAGTGPLAGGWVLLEAAFFPALAGVLAVPLVRTRNVRNLPFLLLLGLLFTADLLLHLVHLGWIAVPPFDPLRLAVNIVLVMVAVVGGRIVPAFTHNALQRQTPQPPPIRPLPWLDRSAVVATVAVAAGDLLFPGGRVAGVLAALAALFLGARLLRWQGHRTLHMPIVWVLHLGYAWLVLGLALKAAWLSMNALWAVNWLHGITAGAFGTMILAVMSRAALGHTGRPLKAPRSIAVAYVLVSIGAAVRIWGPLALPTHYTGTLAAAAGIWGLAFVLFVLRYTPILLGPRADAAGEH